MTLALVLVALGIATPHVVRRVNGRAPTSAVIAASLAALLIVWIGVLGIVVGAAGLAHGLVEFCELALRDPPTGGDARSLLLVAAAVVTMAGRAVRVWWRTLRTTHRARHRLVAATTRVEHDVSFTRLGSVACSVGLLRPRIFVDSAMFPALSAPQRAAVLAHERGHVRGRHGLIDLAARCMAAGLAPLPGARLAHTETRRHLEALADDRAAATTNRRTVAEAIVMAATMPPQPALGAAGWSTWRVDRILEPLPRHRPLVAAAALLMLIALAVLTQTVGHLFAGVHLLPFAFPAL